MQVEIDAHAEQALTQLAREFDQWRQHRRPRFERLPPPLGEQAIAVSQVFPIAQIAKRLRLRGSDWKKRCAPPLAAGAGAAPSTALGFVEVSPPTAWPLPTPATEVDLQRADGARLRSHCHEPQFPVATLIRTFLEAR